MGISLAWNVVSAAPPVVARNLTKHFGEFIAVEARLPGQPGEAFGFLGPNGAGKTRPCG